VIAARKDSAAISSTSRVISPEVALCRNVVEFRFNV